MGGSCGTVRWRWPEVRDGGEGSTSDLGDGRAALGIHEQPVNRVLQMGGSDGVWIPSQESCLKTNGRPPLFESVLRLRLVHPVLENCDFTEIKLRKQLSMGNPAVTFEHGDLWLSNQCSFFL